MSVEGIREQFARDHGRPVEIVQAAPGRVNLIGEHTDYNDGFVLPLAVPMDAVVALARRPDDRARCASRERPDDGTLEYRVGGERAGRGWLDYIQGVSWAFGEARHHVGGFDASIRSDVPLGSGLASSAALLVAVARALRSAFALQIDDVALARLAQRAEVEFVGARVGIMDQLCASLGDATHALFVDTRSLAVERVPLPPTVEVVVVNSGVAHSNAAGDYNTRRAECERACALLGVGSLRDLTTADLDRIATLSAPLDGRARHVVTENARVLDTVAALKAGQVAALGGLMAASHASMRDDYAVSVPEIDALVDIAITQTGVIGARLTGGGFGGSIVALAEAGRGAVVGAAIVAEYGRRTGRDGRLIVPASGASSHIATAG